MLRQFKLPPGASFVRRSLQGGVPMNSHASRIEERSVITAPAKRASHTGMVLFLGWVGVFAFLFACAITLGQTKSAKEDFVRLSAPKPLTFDDLVELEKVDEPNPQLADRLDKLLHTPFLSNEAFYGGEKPHRPS